MSIALPESPRRATVRSFCFVIGALAGVTAGLLTTAFGWPCSVASGALSAGLVAAVPFTHEALAWECYRRWDHKLVIPFTRFAKKFIAGICYFVIVTVVGRGAGSRLVTTVPGPASSLWTPRSSLDPGAYAAPPGGGSVRVAWLRRYACWAWRSGNLWALVLVPFLILLGFCLTPQQACVDPNIYSLF